jgi:hypothetical protein
MKLNIMRTIKLNLSLGMRSAKHLIVYGLYLLLSGSMGWMNTGSVADDFNRINTDPVTPEVVPNPIGSHYVVVDGSWQIGGFAYLQANETGIMYDNRLQALRSDGYAFRMKVNVLHPSYRSVNQSSRQAGVVLNFQDSDNYYLIRWENDQSVENGGAIQIVKRQYGLNTQVDRVADLFFMGGSFYTWEFKSSKENPSVIEYSVSLPGATSPIYQGSFVDDTWKNGYVGFYRSGGGAVRFDDYELSVFRR